MIHAPAFDSVRAALNRFASTDPLPTLEQINEQLSSLAGVHFIAAPTVKMSSADYNFAVQRGTVPTRPNWHDFANALVWATFPKSKRALHSRQAECLKRRADQRLPNRTKEEDALAILDESAVLALETRRLVFGHAILESVALGRVESGNPRGVRLAARDVSEADLELAERLTTGWPRAVADLDHLAPLAGFA